MPIVRFAWWVVSAPFRLFFWFVWQARRVGYEGTGWLQRRIGQRNALLTFAAVFMLVGAGILTGFYECNSTGVRGCRAGWEWLYGGFLLASGLLLAWLAITKVANTRESGSISVDDDFLKYRREDWDLSWSSVLTVVGGLGGLALVLWLSGYL